MTRPPAPAVPAQRGLTAFTTPREREDYILVGDLHLRSRSSRGAGPEFDEAAFVTLVQRLSDERRLPRLVLLGDTFELPPVTGVLDARTSEAAEEIESLTAAYPRFCSALSSWVLDRHGEIDVLLGNHDIALSIPQVEGRLRSLLGIEGERGCRLRIHPWLLHIPGVLHAQHGQQLHDINAFPTLLSRDAGQYRTPPTIGEHLDDLRRALARNVSRTGRLMLALGCARDVIESAAWQATSHSAREREAYRASALPRASVETSLSVQALSEIDRLSEEISRRVLLRLGRKGIHEAGRLFSDRRHQEDRDAYMLHAWPRLADILERHRAGTPVIALGHTHVPRHVRDGTRVLLNPGTWLRERGTRGGAFGRVSVSVGGAVRASLHWWDGCSAHALPEAHRRSSTCVRRS